MSVEGSSYSRTPGKAFLHGILKNTESLLSAPVSRKIGLGLTTALLYYLGTKLGFALTPKQSPISTLWPPNAILLAILLMTRRRDWWIPICFVLPAHLFVQSTAGIPLTTSLGWFVGNVGEGLLGAILVRTFVDPRRMFETVRGTTIFLCFAVIVAPLVTSFIDAANVIFTGWGGHFWAIWTARLFSNSLAELIVVPVIVLFWLHSGSWIKRSTPFRYLEAIALGAGLLVVSLLAFSFENARAHGSPALIYLPLSLLLWAALRFGLGGLSISLATVALISIEGSIHGRGPFASGSAEIDVLSLQILLCTVATPLILLTALMTERRRIEESLHVVAQRLIKTQEEERQRIAQELHDDIGQQLALIESELQELSDAEDAGHKESFAALIEQVSNASISARELSHSLHPAGVEHWGLKGSLQRLVQDFSSRKSIQIHLDLEGVNGAVAPAVSLCLYRISQEALQNVVRHSGATKVSIKVHEDNQFVHLSVVDNGTGFTDAALKHPGLGLIGMRERLRLVDGDMRLSSSLGVGTTLEVTIPMV